MIFYENNNLSMVVLTQNKRCNIIPNINNIIETCKKLYLNIIDII